MGERLKTIIKVAEKRNKISFAGTIFCYDDVVFWDIIVECWKSFTGSTGDTTITCDFDQTFLQIRASIILP